jgi:hypothetical protein
MPRFYFNLKGWRHSLDDEGEEFVSTEAALCCAYAIAWEIGRNQDAAHVHGHSIIILNEHGIEIDEVSLSEAALLD